MEEQIQSQPVSTQPPLTPPVPVRQNTKTLIIVTALAFLLMATGLVYLGYQNYQLKLSINQFLEDQGSLAESSPSPVADPTANWKIYTGGNLTFENFTFKYPSDWDTFSLGDEA